MTGIDKEKILENVKAVNSRGNRFGAAPANVKALENSFADNFFVSEPKDAETVLKEHKEADSARFDEKDREEKAAFPPEGKKKKKKNRK